MEDDSPARYNQNGYKEITLVITAYGDYIVRLSGDIGFDDNILDIRKKMIKALNRRLSSKGYPYAPAYHFASRDTISASSVVFTAMEYIEVDDFMRMRDRKEINDIFVKAVKSVKGLSIGTDGISFDDIDIDIHEFRMLSEFAEDAMYDDCGDDTPVNDFCSDMNPLHLEDDSKWLMAEYGIAFESGFFERQPDIPDDEDKREELCQNMADEMTEAFDADYYGMLESFISNSGMKLIDGGSRIRIAGDGAGTADMHCYSFIMVPSDMDIDEASKLSRIAFRNFDAFISGYGEDTVMLTGVNITEAKIRPLVPGKFLRDLDRIIVKHSELPEEIGIVDDMSVAMMGSVVFAGDDLPHFASTDAYEEKFCAVLRNMAAYPEDYDLPDECGDISEIAAMVYPVLEDSIFCIVANVAIGNKYINKATSSAIHRLLSTAISEFFDAESMIFTDIHFDAPKEFAMDLSSLIGNTIQANE